VNRDGFKNIQFNLSGLGFWVAVFGVFWLLSAVGLGWLVNSFLILIALVSISPVILFLGARWWLKRNLISDGCPVCGHEFMALNRTQCQCPNCGEPLLVEKGSFSRLTPSGTIDVDAVDVSVKQLEDS